MTIMRNMGDTGRGPGSRGPDDEFLLRSFANRSGQRPIGEIYFRRAVYCGPEVFPLVIRQYFQALCAEVRLLALKSSLLASDYSCEC